MTYSRISQDGLTWESLRRQRPTFANGASPPTDADLIADRYLEDVLPDITSPCESYPAEPERIGDQAVWTLVVLSDEDCAATWRAQHQQAINIQVPVYTQTEILEDPSLEDETRISIGRKNTALDELDRTADEDLPDFDTNLSSYAPSNTEYAEVLALRETANLQQNTAMVDAGSLALYSATTVATMANRISFNTQVATTGEGVPAAPAPTTEGYGDQRSGVTLLDEVRVKARVWEISEVVDTVTYYMPKVVLPSIPEGVNPALVYALLYDNDDTLEGHYRTWVPFVQQPDGSWETEFHVSRAKTTPGLWRVCVNNGHESEPYRITRKVYLGEGGRNDNLFVKWD